MNEILNSTLFISNKAIKEKNVFYLSFYIDFFVFAYVFIVFCCFIVLFCFILFLFSFCFVFFFLGGGPNNSDLSFLYFSNL